MKFDKFNLSVLALPLICCLIGVFVLGLGIYESVTSPTKDYAETTGYFQYSVLAENEHYDSQKNANVSATYYLTYEYFVNGEAYKVTSTSATAFVPSVNEEIQVLYDSDNPAKAVIGGTGKRITSLILIGIFFILGSIPFLLVFFPRKEHVKKSKKKEVTSSVDAVGIIFGSIIAVVGYGSVSIICGTFSPVGILNYIDSSFILPMLIPFLMIGIGLFSVIKSIFFNKTINKR